MLTPGPWELVKGSDSCHCCFEWSILAPSDSKGFRDSIAEVLNGTEADARIMTMAPDLLRALDNLQANPNDPAAHRLAMDVMAKARGN